MALYACDGVYSVSVVFISHLCLDRPLPPFLPGARHAPGTGRFAVLLCFALPAGATPPTGRLHSPVSAISFVLHASLVLAFWRVPMLSPASTKLAVHSIVSWWLSCEHHIWQRAFQAFTDDFGCLYFAGLSLPRIPLPRHTHFLPILQVCTFNMVLDLVCLTFMTLRALVLGFGRRFDGDEQYGAPRRVRDERRRDAGDA